MIIRRLHLFNEKLLVKQDEEQDRVGGTTECQIEPITKFGFHTTTCCGFLPLDNTWNSDWVVGY